MKYGWKRTRIGESNGAGVVIFDGGEIDGLAVDSHWLVGAKVGEEWLVNIQPDPPHAFGEIREAKRVVKKQ